MRDSRILAFVILGAMVCAPALAQTPSSPPTAATPSAPQAPQTEKRDVKACAEHRTTVGANNDLQVRNPSADGNLSDKLARSDGVICPPSDVDPEIKAPTPQGGAMPVIPPPGSPGGDPSVRPK